MTTSPTLPARPSARPSARPTAARPRFDSPQQQAYLNLWRTYDRLKALEDAVFAPHEISAQQYNTLRLLKAAHPQPLPTSVLAARLISRAPDMTRLIDKLEQRGLVRREAAPGNRRLIPIAITPSGLQLLRSLAPAVRECHRLQLGHLDEAQLQQLADLLQLAREPHEEQDGAWATDARGSSSKSDTGAASASATPTDPRAAKRKQRRGQATKARRTATAPPATT